MSKYTIGVDFGTLSGRAVLVDVATGEEIATAVLDYPHGVLERALPDGTPLPPQWALQHPQDHLDVLYATIPQVLTESGLSAGDIIGHVGTTAAAESSMGPHLHFSVSRDGKVIDPAEYVG